MVPALAQQVAPLRCRPSLNGVGRGLGDGIRDTVAIDRFKVLGVYINGTCYEDSTLFESLTELLDPAVLYSIPE